MTCFTGLVGGNGVNVHPLRRAAMVAVGVALGVSAAAVPAWAAPPTTAAVSPGVTAGKANDLVPKDSSGRLVLFVDGDQSAAAVTRVGGAVAASKHGRVEAQVPADKVAELSKQPGVTAIRRPDRAIPMGTVADDAVQGSGADKWIAAGQTGAGVKIGIIDPGFADLDAAQAAGGLPPTGPQLTVNNATCKAANQPTNHGTSVAEIVHAMAPDAQLYLACAGNSVEFGQATDWLQNTQHVQVITAAMGFLTSGRGDGTGDPGSPADVVRRTSQAGIFWSVAAGNLANSHYTGKATTDGNGFVTFGGSASEGTAVTLAGGAQATFGLRWDAWPKTTEELDLYVMSSPQPPTGPTDPRIVSVVANGQQHAPGGGEPTAETTITNPALTPAQYYLYVKNVSARPSTNFELFTSGISGSLPWGTPASSITEPATSPYVLAIGATVSGSGQLSDGSGNGPTVDGRQKPDIVGFDGLTTTNSGFRGFTGTSAAAACVAGAAALLKAVNPALDAPQLQAALIAKVASPRSDNQWGHGTLALGPPGTAASPTASGYTALAQPTRILDTTSNVGGHAQRFTPGEQFTLPVPNVPTDAKAVVLNVTGNSDADSSVDIYPGAPAASSGHAQVLRLPAGRDTAVMTVATLNSDRRISLRNRAGNTLLIVDEIGYFSASGALNYFPKATATRVLDTRGAAGTALTGNQELPVQITGVAGVPTTARAVVVDVTATEASESTFLSAYGPSNGAGGTSLLNLVPDERRSNLAVVAIAPDGNIRLYNHSGRVNVAVDVVGWFAQDTGGSRYVPLPDATRVVDTTTGTGDRQGALGQGESASFQVGGLAGVSLAATAAVLSVGAADDVHDSQLTVQPDDVGWSPVTNLAVRQGQALSAAAMPALGANSRIDLRNEAGQAQAQVDVAGYFVGGPRPTGGAGDCLTPMGEAGYTSAFDGRSETALNGWRATGGTSAAVDGCDLVTSAGAGVTWYGIRNYADDYTVKLDWKATADNSDSGLFVGFPNPGDSADVPANRGLEVKIGPKDATGTAQTGAIAGLRAPDTSAANPTGQWNTYEITVAFNTVTVVLNGKLVNTYTTADPARINVNSFIGVQNNGDKGSVRYRNIRLKRNTTVRSGAFVGINNLCLDVDGGVPDSTLVQLHDCNSTTAQQWTSMADGTMMAVGKCLDVTEGGTAAGTQVRLWTCLYTSAQQWILRPDRTLVNPASGRCLTPDSATSGAVMRLQDCTTSPQQLWTVPAQNGQEGALSGPGGRCLDVPNNDPRPGAVAVHDCNGSDAQRWTIVGDGALHAAGKCLDDLNADTSNGATIALVTCNGTVAQQWVLRADGSVVNPNANRCLAAASGDPNAGLVLHDCAGSSLQTWHFGATAAFKGALYGVASKCLDLINGGPTSGNGSPLELLDCNGTAAQVWAARSDGSLFNPISGRCLDITNGSPASGNGSTIALHDCNQSGAQHWVPRPNGSLMNPMTGRCLDVLGGVPSTGNGATIDLYDCNGTVAQQWAQPVLAG
jgi:hypothetical protein